MASVRRYLFETEFAADGAVLHAPAPRKTVYTHEDVEAERAAARAEGEASALAAAERDTAAAVAAVAERLGVLVTRLDAESKALREEAVDLALAAATCVAGAALSRFPEDSVIALFRDVAEHLRAAPRVEVEARADAQAVRAQLERAGALAGFEGALAVVEADDGAPGDVRIAWREGMAAQRAHDALALIREAAARWLAAADAGTGEAASSETAAEPDAALNLFNNADLEWDHADG